MYPSERFLEDAAFSTKNKITPNIVAIVAKMGRVNISGKS